MLFFWHYVGNRVLTLVSNMFTNLNLTDMETCYKVFRREVAAARCCARTASGSSRRSRRKVARMTCRIYEVPISYHGRDYAEGKKITWKDGFVVLHAILKYDIWDR